MVIIPPPIFIICLVTLLFSNSTFAKRAPGAFCDPRVPSIKLDAAVSIVKKIHYSGGNKDKEIFIDEAKLICENNTLTWSIGYRLQAYESGHLYVQILMDGTAKVSKVVKDG